MRQIRFHNRQLMHRVVLAATVLGSCLLAGCGRSPKLETTYGQRRGQGTRSVNGTLVLAHLFEQAGFQVSSWRRLSPKLDREQVIVWTPDRFGVPTAAELDFFESWLDAQEDRTLVFVGRDYDASIEYWRQIMQQTKGDDRIRARQQLAHARAAHEARRQADGQVDRCRWFTLDRHLGAERIARISGPLTGRSGATDVDLPSASQVVVTDVDVDDAWGTRAEPLLMGEGRTLAVRLGRADHSSQIIVIADGSWLLNLPQVNRTCRQLASELIAACGPSGRACFLESGPAGLAIAATDFEMPLVLQLLTVWPVNLFLIHLILIGLVYCLLIWPIFGRPRNLPDDSLADFGKHISAVGEMLARSQDYDYAKSKIDQYLETISPKLTEKKR